jgi:hypothetical protein
MEARAHAAGVHTASDDEAAPASVATVTRVDIGRNADLDSYLYRIEPGAGALLLIVRDGALAYVASTGGWFDLPDEMRGPMFPPPDLSMMAIWARAEGELGLVPGGQVWPRAGGPVHVGFELDRARYESLGSDARAALHDACIPVARDSALLFAGRSGPLAIAFGEPGAADEAAAGAARARDRLIAEFDVP